MFSVRVAGGDTEFETSPPSTEPDPPIDAETDAVLVGLAFEGVGRMFGGGVQLDILASDDDLLEDSGSVDTSVAAVELFPHFTIRPSAPHFRIPIRIGPILQSHSVSFTDDDIDYGMFGLQLEVEPEVDFLRRDDGLALSAYGRGRVGGGFGVISTPDDDFSTSAVAVGGEIGLRFQIAKFLLEGGYTTRATNYAESDEENDGSFAYEADFTFSGAFLALGVRW